MTFKEFQATRRYMTLSDYSAQFGLDISDYAPESAVAVYVYGNGAWIAALPDAGFYLLIELEETQGESLFQLEFKLWEWMREEYGAGFNNG